MDAMEVCGTAFGNSCWAQSAGVVDYATIEIINKLRRKMSLCVGRKGGRIVIDEDHEVPKLIRKMISSIRYVGKLESTLA